MPIELVAYRDLLFSVPIALTFFMNNLLTFVIVRVCFA
jgi:hypothetical protein